MAYIVCSILFDTLIKASCRAELVEVLESWATGVSTEEAATIFTEFATKMRVSVNPDKMLNALVFARGIAKAFCDEAEKENPSFEEFWSVVQPLWTYYQSGTTSF